MTMNNSSFTVPSSSGLTININKVIGTENGMGQGQGTMTGTAYPYQQPQQFGPSNSQQNPWGNNGQPYGAYTPSYNPFSQQQGPQNIQAGNPFADLNQAWYEAEQARNRYVQMANQINDQAYLSYINQNPQYTGQYAGQFGPQPLQGQGQGQGQGQFGPYGPYQGQGQYPYNQPFINQGQFGPYGQPPVVMNQQQNGQMVPPPFVNNAPLNSPIQNGQPSSQSPSPFPTVVPDGPLPVATPDNETLLEEPSVNNQAPSDTAMPSATQPAPVADNNVLPETTPVDTTPQPAKSQEPAPVTVNEDMAYYNELSQKPTQELQGMLRSILSLPADNVQAPVDEKLYSLQTIEYVLDIIKDRQDAATPETFGLLKELGEMSKVMATMPGADIPQWKREDAKIVWMETLWAAAKLDSKLDNIAVKKLPGFSTMIEPILNGKEEVPPLLLMAATQAVSPDVFKYSNDATVQKLLKKVEKRASEAVNKSGKRKWYTLGLGKYKKLSQNEMETYKQVAQYANAIRNGQSVSQLPASGGMPQGDMNGMGLPAGMANFDPSKIDPNMAQKMAAEMEAELAKMSPEERQQFNDALSSVAQEAIQSGALSGQAGGAKPSQADIDALLASLGQPAAAQQPSAAAPVTAPRMDAVA